MCFGGSSAKTDRKFTLQGYGDLASLIQNLSGVGAATSSAGAADTGKASQYFSNIVSGDPSKVMAAVAPEAKALRDQATQQKKQVANLGGARTGGTNAALQDITTKTRGQLTDVIAKQRGSAAGELGKIGAGETSAGINAFGTAAGAASDLASISAGSRMTSQQIHDAAVDQWSQTVADLLWPPSDTSS